MIDEHKTNDHNLQAICLAAILPLAGMIPAFRGGLIIAADTHLHLHRMSAMATLIADGNLYPRWVSWFYLGYGYPIFNFYPPISSYAGGLLVLFGITPQMAFMLLLGLTWMLGSVGMLLLGRHILGLHSGIIAALIWSYTPSRLNEIWQQGSLPQAMATAIIPWVLWALIRLIHRPTLGRSLTIALAYSLLVLTHQPTTLIATIFTAAFGMMYWLHVSYQQGREQSARIVRYGLMSAGLAFGLCAIYLVPLITEISHVRIIDQSGDVLGIVRANFYTIDELFRHPPSPDLTDLSRGIPITYGLIPGALAAVGLIALLRRRKWWLAAALSISCMVAVFLMTRDSFPIWRDAPFLAELRYPRRITYSGVVFFALMAGASLLLIPLRWRPAITSVLTGLIMVSVLPSLDLKIPKLDPANTLSVVDALEYETEIGALGTVSYNEFTPEYGENTPLDPPTNIHTYAEWPRRLYLVANDAITTVAHVDDRSLDVSIAHPTTVIVRQFYFPGWQATVNGERVPIQPDPEYGRITFAVPEGTYRLQLHYAGTTVQRIGGMISIITAIVFVVLGIYARRQHE